MAHNHTRTHKATHNTCHITTRQHFTLANALATHILHKLDSTSTSEQFCSTLYIAFMGSQHTHSLLSASLGLCPGRMGAKTNPAPENAPHMGPPLSEDVLVRTMLHGPSSPVARLHSSNSLRVVLWKQVGNCLLVVLFSCTGDESAPPLQSWCCWNSLHCGDCPEVIKDQPHPSIHCQPKPPLNSSPGDLLLLRITQGYCSAHGYLFKMN